MRKFSYNKIRVPILYIISIIITIIILFPVYWMVVTSFKGSSEVFLQPHTFIPKTFSLEGYK